MRVTETKTTLKGTASFDRPTPPILCLHPLIMYRLLFPFYLLLISTLFFNAIEFRSRSCYYLFRIAFIYLFFFAILFYFIFIFIFFCTNQLIIVCLSLIVGGCRWLKLDWLWLDRAHYQFGGWFKKKRLNELQTCVRKLEPKIAIFMVKCIGLEIKSSRISHCKLMVKYDRT